MTLSGATTQQSWNWRSRRLRAIAWQVLALAVIGVGAWFLIHNTLVNMRARGIHSGFDFLSGPAGFDIGESPVPYDSADPYWKAFAVGVLNTLRVAVIGIVAATLLGTLAGVGRLSRNAILRGLCHAYVELFRNVPVLLQLLMWYILFTEVLPPIDEAIGLAPGVFISKSGLSCPWPVWVPGHGFALEVPVRGEVVIEGGAALTPEFLSVLIGLVIYTGTFIAEVVRAGIQAIPRGQIEAATALGLSRRQQLRLIIMPQALRVIIPPLTNQYLNLTKNSSLAVAIGYPDVVSISNTALNQTGRAVECIALIMAVYLALSLATSALMGWYNRRAAIRER